MLSYLLQDEYKPSDILDYVTGNQRWKYHKRPLVPVLMEEGERYIVNNQNEFEEFPQEGFEEQFQIEERTKSVGVQTDLRESETQTIPFSPQEYIQKGTTPEIC
jgi:glutathionyl-hydroquinone reductase